MSCLVTLRADFSLRCGNDNRLRLLFGLRGSRQVGEADGLNTPALDGCGDVLEEGFAFDFAGGAEACFDPAERGILVTGMADDLPCAGWCVMQKVLQSSRVKPAGRGDAK